MNKRGMSHIEVIIAFLLFIFSIIAGIAFLNPFQSSSLQQASLSPAVGSISAQASMPLETYTIVVHPQRVTNKTVAVSLPALGARNARVESSAGRALNTSTGSGLVYFDWQSSDGRVLTLKVADRLSTPLAAASRPSSNTSWYNLSAALREHVLSEEELVLLNRSYATQYAATKDALHIPGRVDFAFHVEFAPGDTLDASRAIPTRAEVFSQTKRVPVLRTTGELAFAELQVRIW